MKRQSLPKVSQPVGKYSKYYGLFSRGARALGVSPSHVRKVYIGLHQSQRVANWLRSEVARIEGECPAPRQRMPRSEKVA